MLSQANSTLVHKQRHKFYGDNSHQKGVGSISNFRCTSTRIVTNCADMYYYVSLLRAHSHVRSNRTAGGEFRREKNLKNLNEAPKPRSGLSRVK